MDNNIDNLQINKTESLLTVVDSKYDPLIHGEYEEDFEKQYCQRKHKLDDFQIHSILAIKKGHNLLVCAPTSSGKTFVAEYAILYYLLQNKGRVIYTTPIKTLSNEKYAEIKELLRPHNRQPGLMLSLIHI